MRTTQQQISRRRLRRYHWLIVLLSLATALGVSAPWILSQPPIYVASAEVTIDRSRYSSFFDAEGRVGPEFKPLSDYALGWLAGRFERYGTRYVRVIPESAGDGRVLLTAHSLNAQQSAAMADQAAFRITQHVRAAAGRDLLRQLMGYELYLMYHGQPARSELDRQIRELMVHRVFEIVPEASEHEPRLTPEDLADITRALEVRDDELTRIQGLPSSTPQDRQNAMRDQQVLRPILLQYQQQHRSSDVQPSATYISAQAAVPAAPIPQRLVLKFALAAIAGLLGGLLTVLIDRSMGIIAKLRELWSYRELIGNLVARDLKARYKGSVLGYIWSLFNPLLMIAIFYVVFRIMLRSDITYFHIFLMAALLPWNYFSGAILEGMGSIVSNSALVNKVYFPREILPLAAVISNLVNFLLALPVLFLVIVLSGASLTWTMLFLPVVVIIETLLIVGLVLFFSAVTVFFRDTQHIMGVLLQVWFFLTPIFYALEDVVPGYAQYVRWVNPMASIVDFFRDILYGGVARNGILPTPGLPALDGVARTALTALLFLGMGVYVFHRLSGRFSEEL